MHFVQFSNYFLNFAPLLLPIFGHKRHPVEIYTIMYECSNVHKRTIITPGNRYLVSEPQPMDVD